MRTPLFYVLAAIAFAVSPAQAGSSGYAVSSDIAYGALPRQTLDLYMPDTVSDHTPVFVFLFGGGFASGSKSRVRAVGQAFAAEGTIVVAPNYRINIAFPAFIEDAAKAVAFVHRSLTTAAGDPRPIVVGGWSSGAYIGALVSYDQRYLSAEGVPQDAIAGFIGLSGPYWGGLCGGRPCPHTFPPGTEADWPVADFVDPDDPPMLLAWGTRDGAVERGNLDDLATAGEAAGLGVATLILKDASHSSLMFSMGYEDTELRAAAEAFLAGLPSR